MSDVIVKVSVARFSLIFLCAFFVDLPLYQEYFKWLGSLFDGL